MIIHDPEAFCCYKGPVTPIKLRNGTYEIDIREKYDMDIGNIDNESDSDNAEGPGDQPVELVPDGAPHAVTNDGVPNVQPMSSPIVDNRRSSVTVDPYTGTSHESAQVKVMRAPTAPTPAQIEIHNASMHLPYRNWCPICVWGRGKEKAHVKQFSESSMPFFSSDYCFLTSHDQSSADNPSAKEKLTVLLSKSISLKVYS